MKNRVFIVGVGTTKFEKPLTKNWEYYEIGREAGEIALNDARLKFDEIKAAVCSYCYGEPTCGQRAVYELGMTGIPIFNCNNNCSSGSSALMLASSLIKSNEFDCVLALGFEKSGKSLEVKYTNLEFPGQKHFNRLTQIGAQKELVSKHLNYHSSEVLKMFSYSAGEFINRNYNATNNFDTISFKNHKHSKNNENALLQKEFTLEEIKNSPKIFQTVSALSSAPIADGGAAAILCSFRFMMEHGLQKNAVEILSQKMATDTIVTFTGDYSDVCGFYLAKKAANDVFKETNLKMRDVDVLEIHDAFSSMEVQLYAQLGLCKEEETNDFINSLKWVKNENGGEIGIFVNNKKWWCVNPSGGLESKGHPLGATGIAQCAELCLQLRNNANKRQVPGNPKIGLQHNYGLASACKIAMLKPKVKSNEIELQNFYSFLSFSWLSALIYKGFRNPLEYKDLFSLNRSLSAEVLNLEFNTLWKKERKQTNRKPSIHHVIYTFAYREFSGIYLMGLFADLSITFLPFILKYFLKYISISKEYSTSYHEGLIYIFSMLLLSLMNTLFLNLFLQRSVVVGMQVQQAVRSLIYQKSLVLSLSARQEFDAGRISTLIATDTTRIFTCLCYVTLLWAGPLQAILIFGFLVAEIGYSSLYGVILLILLSPLQGYFYKKLSAIRKIVAPITDTRMKLMNEVLLGIRLIKYFSWEDSFAKKLSDIRSRELKLTFRKSIIGAFSRTVVLVIPLFCSLISFVSYGLTNNSLNSSSIFPALSWFAQLQFPLSLVPMAFGFLAEYKIAVSRIDEFLNAQELQERVKIGYNKQYSIEMENCNFVWGSKKDSFRLKNINMKIPTGSLVAIVGKVGSGKSSLLNAILGEMKRELGSVSINGSLGYSPQQAWIQNTSLKQNILFGKPYNRHLYSLAVRNCSLDKDIALLSEGDETEIGEKGINLSGGQKQRVNLARCVYFGSSIVLMDDPLSAVDAHVGKNMFENCIVNGLQGKTRILVTHQLHLLSKVDIIIVMDAGEIVEQGPYQQLLHKKDGIFSSLASSYGGISTTTVKEKRFSNIKFLNESEEVNLNLNKSDDKKNLMSIEERIIGNVSSSVYLGYAKSSSVVLVCFFALALLIFNLAKLGTDYWLIIWSNNQIPHFSNFQYIAVFFAWGLLQAIAIFSFGILVAFIGIAASKNLHDKAMARVLRAPISFFDTTPLGRIVNRFSKDIDGIDNTLSDGLASFLTTISVALSSVVLICYNLQHFFALIMLSLLFFYFILQKVFRANSRELQRLESISSSPLYSHFNDTVDGLSTIRAYHKESFAMEVCNERIDQVSTPFFLLYSCQRWFSIRMDILGALLVFSVGIFAVFERFEVSTAVVGLSVSYALQITGVLSAAVRSFAETESSMNAVERMQHYGNNIPEEAAPVIENSRPPKNWPSSGTIKFEDLDVSYSKDLPLVIKNINFTIKDKQQIGVVGRTGSGKSTMMNALFRIMEPSSGTIYVDGIDIRTIGLSDLRRGLAIIPQDPILFSGTFRSNLDPFGVHSDNDLWNALERANLKSKVMENKSGLDSIIQEGGENLSVGQRQLLCLGRAMLKKPRILVMDEATANVDFETDNIIQKCLREDFKQSTILTIAHRLNTIIDYDLVLVLERGEIAELGSPRELLHIENGKFLALVDETGLTNAKLLKSLAK